MVALGLSEQEAAVRLAADGENAVAPPRPRHLIARIGAQLTDPLVALLLAAGVVTVALADFTDAAVIALVVVLNTAIGVTQEVRADRAIAALDDLTAPMARVVRDGVDRRVPAAEVVRGDVVRVEAGDIVPADMSIVDAYRCQADEAALTGESLPVDHVVGDGLQAGTVIVTGRAVGVVTHTGAHSALGRIAVLVAKGHGGPTPLQRRLNRLGKVLGAAAVGLCLVVFAVGVATGQPLLTMALVAVSLVVAAVPESLPAVVTLALALGAKRMARHKAIPRNLQAVETLGSVTVLASDKTGTLTEGKMAVQQAFADVSYVVGGVGYDPAGEVAPMPSQALLDLARAAMLCSDAVVTDHNGQWVAIGDPMEAALVTLASRCGLDPAKVRAEEPRIAEHPFDQATRQMTTIHQVCGQYRTVCKGAPEAVLEPSPLLDQAQELAASGLRVIAVTSGLSDAPGNPAAPTGLQPLGIIGIGDPLRYNASSTASSFRDAGVRLILITGDHSATAATIGAQVGLDSADVYARIRPEQKLDIIAALQADGQVVAMTGDGVNDAPALRRADIGVAMGGGTEVARQAADLVLVDDNLATVTTAIGEGRRVYDNIRRFLRYGLSGGVAEILVMLIGPFLGMPVPLLPGQILWINLLTHGLPGVALGAEPAEPDVLRRAPRPPGEQVLGDGLLGGILTLGTVLAATTLGVGVLAAQYNWPWQSMVFVTLGLTQLGLAIAVRARGPMWGNPGLLAAVALSAVAQVAAITVPLLRTLLGTQPLTLTQWTLCAGIAVIPAVGLWLHRAAR